MSFLRVYFLMFLSFISLFAHAGDKKVKYVFYFIGDGMSFSQIESANMYVKSIHNDTNNLLLSELPVRSVVSTSAYQHPITCSSAAGTALATGNKTKLGFLCISPDGRKQYESIAEYAKSDGRKVGIISSVFINHATPAAFYAKDMNRDNYYGIGKQLVASGFDYFAGGIIKNADEAGKQSILELAKINRYKVVDTKAEFEKLRPSNEKIIAGSVEMNGGDVIMPYIGRNDSIVTLADYVSKGIELLDNENGFFIMCEGGQIDWACHANDLVKTIGEVIDFDNSIRVAMEFYMKHPDQTLIIITSDHETGGLSLGSSRMGYEVNPSILKHQKIANDVFIENVIKPFKRNKVTVSFEQVEDSLRKYYELGGAVFVDDWDKERLRKAFKASFEQVQQTYSSVDLMYEKYDPLTLTASKILAERAGFGWTSFAHTAMPVPVRCVGIGCEMFNGLNDNTQIAPIIRQLMGK